MFVGLERQEAPPKHKAWEAIFPLGVALPPPPFPSSAKLEKLLV